MLDEPTTGMDVATRQAFWETMRADAATGRTIVFATHYLAEADEFAARTVLMKGGRIVADGPTADVRAAFGGRTVSFRPPADVVHRDGVDPAWLARVGQALAPLGVTDVEVSSASLEAAFLALTAPRPRTRPRALDRTDLAGAPDDRTTLHPPDAPRPRPLPRRAGGYAALDLRRQVRDRVQMFFVLGLPAFMYVVFGLGSDEPVGSGNVAMYVMVSMAAYGAVSATTGVAGSAALERTAGWGRQLALTPLRPLSFLASRPGWRWRWPRSRWR